MRKFASFALFFAIAIFSAQYAVPASWLLPISAFFFLVSLALFLVKSEKKIRLRLMALGIAFGSLWYWGYTQIFFSPAENLDGTVKTTTAALVEYPVKTTHGYSVTVRLLEDRGTKTRFYTYDDTIYALVPGDKISFTAKFSLSTIQQGEEVSYHSARGIFLMAQNLGILEDTGKDSFQIRYLPIKLNRLVRDKIIDLFPKGDIGGFMAALIIGDKSGIDSDLDSHLKTVGISHVVVVSGMHIAFLVGLVQTLLGKKRRAAIFAIPLILLFTAMMGGSPSVVRAAVMQLLLLGTGILKREYDGLTALSFSLLVLLLINPFSIASIGLQLSFASTLGIMLFSGRINRGIMGWAKPKNKRLRKVTQFFTSGFSVSLGATALTLPLSALYFGAVSLVAPFANLLVLWAVSLAFMFGIFACLAGFIYFPLASLMASAISYLIRYVIGVSMFLSQLPLAAVYTGSVYVVFWLIFVYILFGIILFFRGNRKSVRIACGLSVCYLCLAMFLGGLSITRNALVFTVLDVGQGQSAVFFSEDETVIVDCGSSSGKNAGNIAAEYLLAYNRHTVDSLILTHLHADHANGVPTLLSRIRVRRIIMPPFDGSEGALGEEILNLAAQKNIELQYLETDSTLAINDTVLTLIAPIGRGEINERGLSVLASLQDFDVLITGDMQGEFENRLVKLIALPDLEVLVAGHHGSRYSSSEELLDATTPDITIISTGRNNYGHPALDTLLRFSEKDILIYRTDLMGHVTVRRGRSHE